MKPVAVIPMHDPSGVLFPQLRTIAPSLKNLFSKVFVSMSAVCAGISEQVAWLEKENFFHITLYQTNVSVGEDFLTLYQNAAANCHPNEVLHLCFIDRVAFALQTNHQITFSTDVQAVNPEETPLIFRRSIAAWATHPQNYRELENMVTRAGELLFGKSLDFAWCHLAVQAHQLKRIIPLVQNRDMSILAELILFMKNDIRTKDVDWLAWEDPFILSHDPYTLKTEREQSIQETRKRLSYVIPMLQLLNSATENSVSC